MKRATKKNRLPFSKAATKRLAAAHAQMTRGLGRRWKEPINPAGIYGIDRYVPHGTIIVQRAPPPPYIRVLDQLCAKCGHVRSLHGNPKMKWSVCRSLSGSGCVCRKFIQKQAKRRP